MGGRAPVRWEPPSAQSPYFGWIDASDQPNCVRVDNVAAICPNAQGRFCAILANGGAVVLTAEARDRLLKRMGWSEAKLVQGA